MAKRSYQVRPGDKNFLTLSANLGMDYEALKRANPNVQSISTGQYLNLPNLMPQGLNNAFAPAVNAGSITGGQRSQPLGLGNNFSLGNTLPKTLNVPAASFGGASANAGALSSNFSNTFSSASAARSGMPQGVANFNAFAQMGINTGNPNAMSAYRNQENITSQVVAVDQFYQQNGYLPPNISPEVKAAMIAQGANPAMIQQAQQAGLAAQGAGVGDPLAGTPGHYYVDETTAPFVNRIIEVNGRRRILRQDKEGRLYYQKPGMSKRGRAAARLRTQAKEAALEAAALVPQDFRQDNQTTVLNVILGS